MSVQIHFALPGGSLNHLAAHARCIVLAGGGARQNFGGEEPQYIRSRASEGARQLTHPEDDPQKISIH